MAQRKPKDPQKEAMKHFMRDYLKSNDISLKDGKDVNSLMRSMMSALIEEALGGELDEHLGYEPYDQSSKETDNSRNGYSKKTMHTSYGDMDINVPRDRKGEFSPQLVPKYATALSEDMENKIISMYADYSVAALSHQSGI